MSIVFTKNIVLSLGCFILFTNQSKSTFYSIDILNVLLSFSIVFQFTNRDTDPDRAVLIKVGCPSGPNSVGFFHFDPTADMALKK